MSEVKERVRKASDACVSSFEAWESDKKNAGTRESLMEAVHELRKAVARMEIEIAISERDQMASRPIPIPPHRSSRRPAQGSEDFDDGGGNRAQPAHNMGGQQQQQRGARGGGRGRRPSGGGQGGGGNQAGGNE